ncbi:hypothetical protein BCR42DRAFT_394755 [Absidia repens]|uniref:Uncharacterized protein n=1 Tax=Absidia repens TaxID=90262 RepID=A0A1X2I9K5_9FUNG|nr:hypothetical protein BCR42DRAFT_394755 [Absidia repens]
MLPVNRTSIRKVLFSNTHRPYVIPGRSASTGNSNKKNKDPLIPNAPGWDEKNATESEADVKADHDPDDIDVIKKKTTEEFKERWVWSIEQGQKVNFNSYDFFFHILNRPRA